MTDVPDQAVKGEEPPEQAILDKTREDERRIFDTARQFLKPSGLLKFFSYLYSERKLLIFFSHALCWDHDLLGWREQEAKVPETAPYYWMKRVAPPLEFGAMHAILFQMALLPITMSRYTIAAISESVVDRFVPLNRMVRLHIHLGYTMVTIVFFATVFFFFFFGLLCANGEQGFCDKFTSEIIITGYIIFAFLIIIGVTSYFRHSIPYELFYIVHHVVFLMYLVAIVHTLDVTQRNNDRNRSQTFKWFSATLLYYVCDRAAMHINHRHNAHVVQFATVSGSDGSNMIILKLRRPVLFNFKPGQYAFIKLPEIDINFHPFSIASGPESPFLEFYIEVFGEKSWTAQVWNILKEQEKLPEANRRQITFEVMGPYGTSLAKTSDFSHAIAVGAGTGIVPVLSLFQQHLHQLKRLDPDHHLEDTHALQQKSLQIEIARESRKGSFMERVISPCQKSNAASQLKADPRQSLLPRRMIKKSIHGHLNSLEGATMPNWAQPRPEVTRAMKKAAFRATREIYTTVIMGLLPVLGLTLIGLTLSWNTIRNRNNIPELEVEVDQIQYQILAAFTVVFQFGFAVVALCMWSTQEFAFYVDTAAIISSPFLDWRWFSEYSDDVRISNGQITIYSLVIGYMMARLWNYCVKPRNNGIFLQRNALDKLQVIWVTRSAHLVAEILPEITETWNKFVENWGEENAKKVCSISIYCTDKDQNATQALSPLLKESGFDFHFERPEFSSILEEQSLDQILTHECSRTVLAFCGSPQLARALNGIKIQNDSLMSTTGHSSHLMHFVAESYGGTKPGKAGKQTEEEPKEALSQEEEALEQIHNAGSSSLKSSLTSRRMSKFYPQLDDFSTVEI